MYTGETVSETLAPVIKDRPDLDGLPPETPPHIRRLLKRCLEKDPQRRLQAIGEARIAIDEPAEEAAPGTAAPLVIPPRRGVRLLLGLAIGIAIVSAAVLWLFLPRPAERPLMRFSVDMGPDAVMGPRTTVVLSPDGTRIVFPVRSPRGTVLSTRLLDQSTATLLAGTENATDAFFSPDGEVVSLEVWSGLLP
jgi:eukaryotic-like serine/threonine-protein kinase